MTVEADASAGLSLVASLNGLSKSVDAWCDRMDREARLRQRAMEAYRQVPFVINVPLVAGAATINPSDAGPNLGFYWSIRKVAAVGFTAGTVSLFIDNTGGEPLIPFTQAGVSTAGKSELLIPPNSNIAITATGITGTVQIWGRADQFESWLLPWYAGAQRDG